jgi:flagellar biosynthesis protein FlhB
MLSFGLFFFSSIRRRRRKKKTIKKKKNAKKGGNFPSSSHFALSLLAFTSTFLLLPFYFKHFLLGIFFFSKLKFKNKKIKNNKNREEKNAEKGGRLPSSSHSTFSLLAPTFSLLFLPFYFKCFLLGIFFFSSITK